MRCYCDNPREGCLECAVALGMATGIRTVNARECKRRGNVRSPVLVRECASEAQAAQLEAIFDTRCDRSLEVTTARATSEKRRAISIQQLRDAHDRLEARHKERSLRIGDAMRDMFGKKPRGES